LLSTHKPYESKNSAYECGFSPVSGQTRSTFQIHFYLVAMLFLVFDLEILLLFPIALSLYQVSFFGFSVALIFFIVLTIGFVLEIGSGAISLKNSIINKNNTPLACEEKHPNNNYYKFKLIKQQKATFCTSAIHLKENLMNITTNSNSYWETIHEKDIGQKTNNPHIIARRQLINGGLTDAKIINLVQSQL